MTQLVKALKRFTEVYGFRIDVIRCSEFMRSEEYGAIFLETKEKVQSLGLTNQLSQIVPENKRYLETARSYPIHELACVQFLASSGFSLKVGPTKEKQYDGVIHELNPKLSFAYLLDAYALGTRTADIVVHYVPTSRGPNNGQRIFLEDDERKIQQKLQQSCDETLRYFCRIASISGHILGLNYPEETEINYLYGRKLKRETINLVLDNIVRPYRAIK